MFLAQETHQDCTQVIFNNSNVPLTLDLPKDQPKNLSVWLINSCDTVYSTLGQIYNHALTFLPKEGIIVHYDDDDCILPNHAVEGINGFREATFHNKLAYKPSQSYYYEGGKVSLTSNVMEPSIFIDLGTLKKVGYNDTTSDQHLKWVTYLTEDNLLYVDPRGVPTLLYEWGNSVPTFKTSGNPSNPNNFQEYRHFSQDHGDRIVTPWSKEKVKALYNSLNLPK